MVVAYLRKIDHLEQRCRNMLTCQWCQKTFSCHLTMHIRRIHKRAVEDYLSEFPGAILIDPTYQERVQAVHRDGRTGKTQKHWTEESKRLHAKKTGDRMRGKKRPKHAVALKLAWERKRKEWTDGLRKAMTSERRAKCSESMQRRLARDGYHLGWKMTKLEKFLEGQLKSRGLTVQRQRRSADRIMGRYRFYDFFIPEMNLLIEADGEYWHRKEGRIAIDKAKQEMAIASGHSFARISDKDIQLGLDVALNGTDEERIAHANELIVSRSSNPR
jgi:very-short-patch-repair endonuclease